MRRWCVLTLVCVMSLAAIGGCGARSALLPTRAGAGASRQGPDPRQVQSATMSFADRYLTATGDVYDRVRTDAPTARVALEGQRAKIRAGMGALSNAANPHPVAGLMDMAIMVHFRTEAERDRTQPEANGERAMYAGWLSRAESDAAGGSWGNRQMNTRMTAAACLSPFVGVNSYPLGDHRCH